MQTLTELFAEYEDTHLRRHLARTTAANYRGYQRALFAYLPQPPTVAHLTRINVRRFLLGVFDAHPRTLRTAKAAIIHFLKWLKAEEVIATLPTANMDLP